MKILTALLAMLPALVFGLDPAQITITNFRGEAVSAADAGTFYRGDQIHFTNCVMYSGATTSSAVQNLTALTITVTHGDTLTAGTVVTGAITTATGGVWNAAVTLSTNEADKTGVTYIQVRITDGTNSFTYPMKTLNVKSKL
jgi:hypothetical protein